MKSQKVTFQKSQKLLTEHENLHERPPIQSIQYSFNIKGGL